MSRLREHKKRLRQWLSQEHWQDHLPDIVAMDPKEATGPLLSFLLLGEDMTHRAACALGPCIAKMCTEKTEDARNIVRRLMWHMNEESGNIGWGIPEAFAEILVHSEKMAQEFHPILLSYIMDTGRDDNFCDHATLRRSCYWAVGRLAKERPALCVKVIPWLIRALHQEAENDVICRGLAVWALTQFPATMLPSLEVYPMLRRLAQSPKEELQTLCPVFDGQKVRQYSLEQLIMHANIL